MHGVACSEQGGWRHARRFGCMRVRAPPSTHPRPRPSPLSWWTLLVLLVVAVACCSGKGAGRRVVDGHMRPCDAREEQLPGALWLPRLLLEPLTVPGSEAMRAGTGEAGPYARKVEGAAEPSAAKCSPPSPARCCCAQRRALCSAAGEEIVGSMWGGEVCQRTCIHLRLRLQSTLLLMLFYA